MDRTRGSKSKQDFQTMNEHTLVGSYVFSFDMDFIIQTCPQVVILSMLRLQQQRA